MSLYKQVVEVFSERFGGPPTHVVRAPGRVNLIGEHTDYNDGFVLPMAIDRAVWAAVRPRPDSRVLLHSLNFEETADFALDSLSKGVGGWQAYVTGTAWALLDAGYDLSGWEGVFIGDVPIGSGLSSSAALEMAIARAFTAVSEAKWDAVEMAKLGQRTENEWIGVNSGIMDQMISAAGQADHAILIDCRSLEMQPVPIPAGTAVIVLDTATRRGLVDSAYNERRAQCMAAAQHFGVPALRDVTLAEFVSAADTLDPLTQRRARHVISENERVHFAAEAMQRGDVTELGQLMVASHKSLRDDFEVSSEALDAMVDIALAQPGCYGARMTGAGFGGCAVALVAAEQAAEFARQVQTTYQARMQLAPSVYICTATDGAAVIDALADSENASLV